MTTFGNHADLHRVNRPVAAIWIKAPAMPANYPTPEYASFRAHEGNVGEINLVTEPGHMALMTAYRINFNDGRMWAGILAPGDMIEFGPPEEPECER